MTVDPRDDVPDARLLRALWTGLLLPPAAFLLNLEVAYALVPTACSTHNPILVHLVHIACLALAVVGGITALRTWRRSGATWPGGQGGRVGRTQFMAGLGVLLGVLFTLVILAQWIPSFMLSPCQ
jgi:hypothetical protein